MFGLPILYERLAFIGIIVAVIFGFAWHERSMGAQKCLSNVQKANVVEQKKEEKQYATDTVTVQSEGKTYADTTRAPLSTPAPVIRLGMCPKLPGKAVSGSSTPGPSTDVGTESGGGDQKQPTLWDTTARVKTGRDADAQIRRLQDYIIKVCRPK